MDPLKLSIFDMTRLCAILPTIFIANVLNTLKPFIVYNSNCSSFLLQRFEFPEFIKELSSIFEKVGNHLFWGNFKLLLKLAWFFSRLLACTQNMIFFKILDTQCITIALKIVLGQDLLAWLLHLQSGQVQRKPTFWSLTWNPSASPGQKVKVKVRTWKNKSCVNELWL